jgi:hypothetical protein
MERFKMASTTSKRSSRSGTPGQEEQAALTPTAEKDRLEAPALSLDERIALLAYSYWQARGCPFGSAEEDWFRAEREIEED